MCFCLDEHRRSNFDHLIPPLADGRFTATDLGLLPGGTTSSGRAINNQGLVVGLATDSSFNLLRPAWDANAGAIIGFGGQL